MILDTAGAKGTGKWMSQLALDLGVPSTLVTEAVYARCLSAMKDARVRASKVLPGPSGKYQGDREEFIEQVRQALYASKICSYAQGFVQMQAAAAEHNWPLEFGPIALLWRGGCIIRAVFLERIKEAFDADPQAGEPALGAVFHRGGRARPRRPGGTWSPRRCGWAFPRRPSPRPWPTTTATARSGCRPTCCRPSAITSAPTPTTASTGEGVFHSDWLRLRKQPPEKVNTYEMAPCTALQTILNELFRISTRPDGRGHRRGGRAGRRRCARGLAQAGAHVIVADLTEEGCKARVAEPARSCGGKASYCTVNVT